MRTTLDIAEDILQVAKERARREKTTVGAIVSELARTALTAPPMNARALTPKTRCGFRPFPRRGAIVTNDLIDKLRDDDAY